MMKSRVVLIITLAAFLLSVGVIGIGVYAAEKEAPYELPESSILNQVPAYVYEGVYINRYDMSAGGLYSAKNKPGTVDPSLNGQPVVDELGGGEMLVFKKVTSAEGFTQYRKDLEDSGYRLYAENNLNDNLFATYVTEDTVVTLTYMPSYQQFNILAEPMRALPGLEEENVYQNLEVENKVVLTTVHHIAESRDTGMCVLYQLCDGSFVIIDSGYGMGFYPHEKTGYENVYQNVAKEIYGILENLAPNKDNIVIAGWFFTHPHWDHIGGLGPFADLYGDKVKVEKFVINHPNRDTIQQMWDESDANLLYVQRMQDAFAKFAGAQVVEAHAGQTFYLRDAVIDVLCTWELQTEYSVNKESICTMNDASLILDIRLGGERSIILGDSDTSCTAYLEKMYGSWLKADIVTTAHHGINNCKQVYTDIDPDVVLWTRVGFKNYLTKDYNKPLKEADVIYNTDDCITILPLPFTGEENALRFDAPVYHGKTWDEVYPGK